DISIEAISGATITSQAIVSATKEASIRIITEINERNLKSIVPIKKDEIKLWQNQSVNPSEASEYD
ncbi:FMN-binding protein, partial [Candidatus Desantisbacteria bacterium]|nr:FMN-binding protein [Candidatus Desantisbacteria bacterium]